jgi:hypothetical protein
MSVVRDTALPLLILSTCILVSCSEDNRPLGPTVHYRGITVTNEDSPVPISIDPEDWCFKVGIPQSQGDSIPSDVLPSQYSLGPAYPNPASAIVTIPFGLPISSHVTIYILLAPGVVVREIVDEPLNAGMHVADWPLDNQDGEPLPRGIYRCVIEAGDFSCFGDIQIK